MATVQEAAAALGRGELALIPTDTVYGVAAPLRNQGAIDRLFVVKQRPKSKALPVLAASPADLEGIAHPDPRALFLARRFWPGPLTIVLRRGPDLGVDLGGAGDTVAVRVPAFDVTLDLLRRTGPLAVTSANVSGGEDPATLAEARAALGHAVAVFVDGGRLQGRASTVVSLVAGLEVLREGALAAEEVGAALDEAGR